MRARFISKSILNSIFIIICAVFSVGIILAGCSSGETEEDVITSQELNAEELAPFVEPDFPFITTSVDARELGESFPEDNVTPRCLAIRLGTEAYSCFDTDMLRWSAAWTGDFIAMVNMAQISYHDFHNKDNEIPTIQGDPKIATGVYPGWMAGGHQFNDPRSSDSEGPAWGPIPSEIGSWNGVHTEGDEVVLDYTIGETDILEFPSSVELNDETAFLRTFEIGSSEEMLSLAAAEITDLQNVEVTDSTAWISQEENGVTAVGLVSEVPGISIEVVDERYITVQVSAEAASQNTTFSLILWKGDQSEKDIFTQLLTEAQSQSPEVPEVSDGGSAYWTQTVRTKAQLAPDTSAYAVDQLTLPLPNPWDRNVRVVDVDFFSDGRAAVVTFEGDVWIVKGIGQEEEILEWNRFASGLYEPQSIEVVQDTIYTFGKEGIIRFHDTNDNGNADYYENFSGLMEQSMETREWASDMVVSPDGSFYVAKFGALDMGPETATTVREDLAGFRKGSQYAGSISKISSDGQEIEHYATGFRGPYLGMHPEKGILSASDQQGHSMPSTPIMLVNEEDYYGVPATAHADPVPEEVTPPLTWIPHSVDRSGAGQVWINSDKMGSLNEQMVHLSYGRPGLFKVLIDSINGEAAQGAVSVIPGHYPAPTHKGDINPVDGQLYVGGFSLWGSNSEELSALVRLRNTGSNSLLPEKFGVYESGVLIRFGDELDKETVADIANYQVKRWNYERTEEYGSGHYKLDGSPGEEMLPVFSAHLSEDQRSVFLAVPDMQEVMQMEVSYNFKTENDSMIKDKLWFSANQIRPIDFTEKGFPDVNREEILNEQNRQVEGQQEEIPVTVERGKELFQETGCIACHSVDGTAAGKTGPTVQGLFNSERILKDSTTVVADADYIREAILEPNEKVPEGYEAEMPSFLGVLSDREIEAIILYIESLSD